MFHMMLLSEESYVIDFSSMPLQLVFHALLVLVLFFILGKLLFKPVQKILDKRKEMVQSSIDDAQQKQQQAQELKAEYDQKLAAAMTERDQIIQDAYKTAQEKICAMRYSRRLQHGKYDKKPADGSFAWDDYYA